MYEFFEGKLAEVQKDRAIVDVGGIGFVLAISATTAGQLPPPGERARLFAHLVVTDGEPRLFGFATAEEREIFRLLLGVSGVGPSTALALVSALSPKDLVQALAEGNEGALRQVRGVGAKTASRLVVDLRETAQRFGALGSVPPAIRDAVSALVALGFLRLEAERLVHSVERELRGADSETLVKRALAASRGK